MRPVVLFGAGKVAEVVLYYLNASGADVAVCSVDDEYVRDHSWNGLPVVPFSQLATLYPPEKYDMFVALGYQDMNALREGKCREARSLGYKLISYVNHEAGIPTDCQYGDNCFIMDGALVHPKVRLGNNVFVWSGALVGHHSAIDDNSWLSSCANVAGVVSVGKNCFFSVNSTVTNSISIGNECFLGANALVSKPASDGQVFLAEGGKPFRLNSRQFLRMSRFSDI